MVSPARRLEILDALRRGTVPRLALDALAVGLQPFDGALGEELDAVRSGRSVFKALRGEYGAGKTFFARWLQDRARREGFATAEVQISETETPLHRLETVYRRVIERLSTAEALDGAFRMIIDSWFYGLEQEVLSRGAIAATDAEALARATEQLLEQRLASVSRTAPMFAVALRGYRRALSAGRNDLADGILAWLGGQPQVGMESKRFAGVKGEIDNDGAGNFLQGLLVVLRDAGHSGLLMVLDEVETLQRVRGDVRDKALNALRQLIDDVHGGRYPGLYLLVTGTPAFFDGPQGAGRLAPLAQRLHVDFGEDPRFDNPRAIQVRLRGFNLAALEEVGRRVRNIYVEHSSSAERVSAIVDDAYVALLARAVAGEFGDRVGVAPRLFLKKLVDVLDRVEQIADFDPRRHYSLTIVDTELSREERAARGAKSVDDVQIDV